MKRDEIDLPGAITLEDPLTIDPSIPVSVPEA
jgi:hypothetical protein